MLPGRMPSSWTHAFDCRCTGCKQKTVPCVNACGAAAKGDVLWDNHFCSLCEGEIYTVRVQTPFETPSQEDVFRDYFFHLLNEGVL